jgi:hypothetical protein
MKHVSAVLIMTALILLHSLFLFGFTTALEDMPEAKPPAENIKSFAVNSYDEKSIITSKIVVVSLRKEDSSLLVSMDGSWPPFRISLVDMALYWKFSTKAEDITVGTVITIHPSMLDSIPIISSPTGWPEGSGRPSQVGFEYLNDQSEKVSVGRFKNMPTSSNLLKERSSNAFNNEQSEELDLRTEQELPPGSLVIVPVLLDYSFAGPSQQVRSGETLVWKFSIQQGDSPIASLKLNFRGSFNVLFSASQSFAVPVGFNRSRTVTNFTVSFPINDVNQYLPGYYNFESLTLTAQACPANFSVTFGSYGSITYSSASPILFSGPNYFPGFTLPYLSFGSGTPPALRSPELLSFTYNGGYNVRKGDVLWWSFQIRQGTYPLQSVALTLRGPQLQLAIGAFGSKTATASFSASQFGGESSTLTGSISIQVTDDWLEGEYNCYYCGMAFLELKSFGQGLPVSAIYSASGPSGSCSGAYTVPCCLSSAPSYCHDFTQPKINFFVGSSAATVASPSLLSFAYTGPQVAKEGDVLSWDYVIAEGSGPAVELTVAMSGCVNTYFMGNVCRDVYYTLSLANATVTTASGGGSGGGSGSGYFSGFGTTTAGMPPPTTAPQYSGYDSGYYYSLGGSSDSGGGFATTSPAPNPPTTPAARRQLGETETTTAVAGTTTAEPHPSTPPPTTSRVATTSPASATTTAPMATTMPAGYFSGSGYYSGSAYYSVATTAAVYVRSGRVLSGTVSIPVDSLIHPGDFLCESSCDNAVSMQVGQLSASTTLLPGASYR